MIGLRNYRASVSDAEFTWLIGGDSLSVTEYTAFIKDNDYEKLNCISFVKSNQEIHCHDDQDSKSRPFICEQTSEVADNQNAPPTTLGCPTEFPTAVGDHCYVVVTTAMTLTPARDHCVNLGGDLGRIYDWSSQGISQFAELSTGKYT